MTNAPNPPPPADPPKGEEVPLEDIDKLLEAEDPEFTKQLEEVRSVEIDKNVVIEASVADDADALPGETQSEEKPKTKLARVRLWLREKLATAKIRIKARMATAGRDFVVFLKTRPKEFALFVFATLKLVLKKGATPVRAFQQATGGQKLLILVLVLMSAAALWILRSNFKGVWIPQINEPLLNSFEEYADFVEDYDPKDGGDSFYSAFPQERHEFLFGKMKVNLRRTSENPLPMGAFEVVVQVDSKDTAIELKDREVEFSDYLQRVFEDETFGDLETEIGKNRLKSRLKSELNKKLTQGWVKDITFKTFVLKP